MPRIDQIDDHQLLDLIGRTDPLGVLSVYATVDPSDHAAAGIDIGNRLRELRARIRGAEQGAERLAALDQLQPRVEQVTNPTGPGRGRLAFFGLSDGWSIDLHAQLPVPQRVVLDEGPFVHPLLELRDAGRAAGVIMLSAAEARLLEWRFGEVVELSRLYDEYREAAHERAGQIGGGPPGQFHTPMIEHRQSREQEQAQRFVRDVARAVTGVAAERGWRRILLTGADRWLSMISEALPTTLGSQILTFPRVLAGRDRGELVDALTQRLSEDHAAREHGLAQQVNEAAGRGTGALGLSEVTAALNEGRVTHLIYDPQVRYAGSVSTTGMLQAGSEAGPGGATPEPRLTERLVERALATRAGVSPVEGAARGVLADADGIAALLRW